MLRIFRVAPLALLLVAAACARDPGDPSTGGPNGLRVPSEAPDIIGTVTSASAAGDNVVVVIEQDPTRGAGYPIASVTVSPRSRVLRRTGDGVAARAAGGAGGGDAGACVVHRPRARVVARAGRRRGGADRALKPRSSAALAGWIVDGG